MQLRIEPSNTGQASGSGTYRRRKPSVNAWVLDLLMQRQSLPKWCWAAIAASLARYYQSGPYDQHELASALLGIDCTHYQEPLPVAAQCDNEALLHEALTLVGCYSHWSPGRPSFEHIQTELESGRPVCVRIEWHAGGSHYIALIGYYADTGEVYVEDPLHGPSIHPFHAFPDSYRISGGVWRETYWTRPPHVEHPRAQPAPATEEQS